MSKRNKPRKSKKVLEEQREELGLVGKKKCTKCKIIKDKDEFSIEYSYTLSSWCKSCHREYSREYRKRDGEKERQRVYKSEYRKRKRREAKEKLAEEELGNIG